jgi:hypothetical protein
MNSKELSEILNLIEVSGGKYVIVEGGKPKYAIMDMDEYKCLANNQTSLENLSKDELIQRINKDIAIWREGRDEDNLDENLLEGGGNGEDTQYFYEVGEEAQEKETEKDYF